MSAHVCGCDPDHKPVRTSESRGHQCENFPRCAYGKACGAYIEDRLLDGYHPGEPRGAKFAVEPTRTIDEAWALTHGDRREAYGTPAEVFAGYAKMWSGLLAGKLKTDLTAEDVALCMTALKLARQANAAKRDNIVDAHGYLILLEEV